MKTHKQWETEINNLIDSKSSDEARVLRNAVKFANKAHLGATRKATGEPYIVHPYEVCLTASTITDDIDVLVAALFHDVVEDTDYSAEDIRAEFGDRVTSFVQDESEDKMENIPKAMSWLIRKEKFLEHLEKAPVQSQIICLSDKISNLRSMAVMHAELGDKIWDNFNQKDPNRHAWYYRTIAETLRDNLGNTSAFKEYETLFYKIFKDTINVSISLSGGLTMEINEQKCIDNIVYIEISGRITSSNADELYNGAKEIIGSHPGCEMVYDIDKLEMISSAGLRVFLKLKKEGVTFKIINACSEVYEVFDMTGFVSIFDIKKAYRKMNVDGCEKIGEGAKGIVYKIDDETIIKVYKYPDCMDDIVKERECARKALVMGVPTAIPFDIVLVDGKFGSVFELVSAKSVTNTVIDEPSNEEEIVREYARIMKEMHEVKDNGSFGITLPKIKDEIVCWAEFAKERVDEEYWNKIDEFVDSVEDAQTLLHGDGHPNNVMCTRDGMIFIDMDTLCTGDAKADIGVVYTALVGYKTVDSEDKFIPTDLDTAKRIWSIFVDEYYKGMSREEIEAVEEWCKKFAYLRLYRRGIRKETNKPHFAENALCELKKAFA